MQASKIIPGKTYAVKRADKLLRFHVGEVTTVTKRRNAKAGPNDHSSEVRGFWAEEDLKGEAKLSPDEILGPFEEHVELVQRQADEKAERKRQDAERLKQARADRKLLYAFVGKPVPSDEAGHGQLFRIVWGSSIDISRDGVADIIARIRSPEAAKG